VAEQNIENETEAKADVLPVAKPVEAPAADPVKTEPAKAEAVKAAPAPAKAPTAKAPKVKSPARRAKKTVKTRKPANKPAARTVQAKPAKPVVKAARTAKPALKSKPARAGATTIRKGIKTMATQTNKATETAQYAAAQLKTVFGDVNERAKGAVEKSARVAEELADLTRGNVEAFVASSKVAAKGVEAISQNAAEYGRKSFEDASAVLKSFAEVKSATDFFKLQGDFARSAFDAAVAESARVSETVLKLAGDVAEPLTSRYTVAAERVKTLAA
jgi:phasin family protein